MTAALKEAGISENTPITKHFKGISLRSGLKLLLDELQLKYVIHNEVLLITSPEKAEQRGLLGDRPDSAEMLSWSCPATIEKCRPTNRPSSATTRPFSTTC